MNATLSQRRIEWLQRPVAILGRGESGQAVANLIIHFGGNYHFYCQDPKGHSQDFHSREASRHDLVVFSPGFSIDHPWLETARAVGCRVMGEVEFARLFWSGEVWTVTGTNGKTTSVSLLVHALQSIGKQAIAVGNIGHAFSRAVLSPINRAETIAVCEISSFQSEAFTDWESDAGIWTHFSPNHLDRHGDLRTYFLAKIKALNGIPGQRLFIGPTVWQMAEKLGLRERIPPCSSPIHLDEKDPRIPQFFRTPAQWSNLNLAASLWESTGRERSQFIDSLASFVPPQHRIARVGEVAGIEFWDDSKATNSAAVGAALDQFPGRTIRWIGGGLGKGEALHEIVALLAPRIHFAYTIGATGPELAEIFNRVRTSAHFCETLDRAVDIAFQDAQPGDLLLLSPGFASFDQFRGYAERGECFQQKVLRLSSSQVAAKKELYKQKSRFPGTQIPRKEP